MGKVVVTTVEGQKIELTGADLKKIREEIDLLSSKINEKISEALARVSHKQSSI